MIQCVGVVCNIWKLAELRGFARDSRSIIIVYVYLWQFSHNSICDPQPSHNVPRGIEGLILLTSYANSHADGSAYVCQIWSRSVQGFDSFPRFKNWWPPNSPCPSGMKGLLFISYPFPDEYEYVSRMCSRSVQLFCLFPTFWNLWPPDSLQMPLGARGINCLAYVHSRMNMYTCAKFDPVRSSGLEAFPDLWIYNPLTHHAPRISRGNLLAHVHSQIIMHTYAKFGPDRSCCMAYFPHVLMCDP